MTKQNKIESLEDFKEYNIICTTTKEVEKCLEVLNTEEQNKEVIIDTTERIVYYDNICKKYMSRMLAEYDKDISYYHFKQIYKKLKNNNKKQQERESNPLVEFMKSEPIDVIIYDKNDYDNLIDYLDIQGIKWNSGLSLKSPKHYYYNELKSLTFYSEGILEKGLMSGTKDMIIDNNISVKKLFKKFNIEYKELPDFECDENGRIIKINNYNSEKTVYELDFASYSIKHFISLQGYDEDILDEYVGWGLLFNSKEALENYIKYLTIHTKIKNLANRLNNGKKIDWSSELQPKYFLYFNYRENCISSCRNNYNYKDNIIYCIDKNFKDEAIKEISEEDLKWYLKQSY